MLFWRKNKAREIRNDLCGIEKRTGVLVEFERKKGVTHEIIQGIKANIAEAKNDILDVANEEKTKAWIDLSYDSEIDRLAKLEVKALEKLEQDISFYEEWVAEARNENDLNSLIEQLIQEESIIREREKGNEQIFKEMEKKTLASRLRRLSYEVPALKTNDGVSWKKIAITVRQLGGWIVAGGRVGHFAKIKFRGARMQIPCSEDIGSGRLAAQIRVQLKFSMPPHKVPSINFLQKAFKRGGLLSAA